LVIHIILHSIYRKETPEGLKSHLDLELEGGTTLGKVIELLGYADQIDHMLLVINGQIADRDDIPNDGDTVRIMPVISGGYPE